jgi:hypothetical protein
MVIWYNSYVFFRQGSLFSNERYVGNSLNAASRSSSD